MALVTFANAVQGQPLRLTDLDANFAALSGGSGFVPPVTISKLNTGDAFTFKTPDPTAATWDTQPIAALRISGPDTATTRNFIAGLWVITNGAAIDKGRGILVQNIGQSDGIYIQQDGINGTGQAILLTATATSATAMVIGTTLSTQIGLVLRQETSILPAADGILMTLQADGTATEMVRVGSTIASQTAFVFRLFGANSKPIVVKDASSNDMFVLNNAGDMVTRGQPTFVSNTTPPAAGSTAAGIKMSNVADFGLYFGTGAPTFAAAQGSQYLRRDGSSNITRAYINTNGGTTWTAMNTVA